MSASYPLLQRSIIRGNCWRGTGQAHRYSVMSMAATRGRQPSGGTCCGGQASAITASGETDDEANDHDDNMATLTGQAKGEKK